LAAAILHFGQEIDECFPLLRQRGYSIHCVQNVFDLHQARQSGAGYDLVSSTNVENSDSWVAADEARKHLLVPAILFHVKADLQSPQGKLGSAKFENSDYDLVIPADESSQCWIPKVNELVSLGQRLRGASKRLIANSKQFRQETAFAIEKTRLEIERAKAQLEQNDLSLPIPNMLADRILKCKSCGESFVFHAGEQLSFQLHRLMHVPDKCSRCKSDRRAL
jgi:Probable zinc-ribbon domain